MNNFITYISGAGSLAILQWLYNIWSNHKRNKWHSNETTIKAIKGFETQFIDLKNQYLKAFSTNNGTLAKNTYMAMIIFLSTWSVNLSLDRVSPNTIHRYLGDMILSMFQLLQNSGIIESCKKKQHNLNMVKNINNMLKTCDIISDDKNGDK